MSEHGDRNSEAEPEEIHVGHEAPAEFARLMDERGEEDGSAGLADELTVDEDAPPPQMARQAAKSRIGFFKGEMAKERRPWRRTVAEGPGRVRKNLAGAALKASSIAVQKERLRECRADVPYLSKRRDRVEAAIAEIPFYRRGLASGWVVVAVLGAVAAFDAAVMRSALEQTALDTASIWITTVGIAALLAAVNEAFGLLLGVVVRRAGRRRLLVLGGVLIVGLIGLFASIAMLGWFRHEVALSQNHGLGEIASGHEVSFDFIIDPLFLAPLQAVGCIAAMAVVALYALSSEWRALRLRLAEARTALGQNDADIAAVEAQIAAAHEAGRTSFLRAFDAEADASGAQAEIASSIEQEEAMVEAETALGEEMVARYRGKRNFVKHVYENGKVRRAAMSTQFGRRSTHTPEACDVEVDPEGRRNGHDEDADADQPFFDARGL